MAAKGCVIQCSQIYNDINGKHKTSGFEYESIWALGADCTVDNLDKIAEMDHILDDIGIDTIETAVAFGVAMDGGVLDFGDADEMIRIMREEVGKGTPLGRIIGNGAGNVGRAYGVTRVPVVKNQALPAYDPRAIKGIGITYAHIHPGRRSHHGLYHCHRNFGRWWLCRSTFQRGTD